MSPLQVRANKIIRSCVVLSMLMEPFLLLEAQTHMQGYSAG